MRSYIIFSVVCLQLGWTYGVPAAKGVAAFSYQDSTGNRYGGTYDLDDAQVYPHKRKISVGTRRGGENFANAQVYTSNGAENTDWGNFAPFEKPYQQYDNFIPEYFNNLQNLLNDVTGRRTFTSPSELEELERFAPLPPLKPLVPFKLFKPLPPLPPLQPLFPPLPPLRPFEPLKPLPPLRQLVPFQPLPPLPPLQPLWPFKPFPPLQPFQPLQPLWPFKPFPPLQPFQPLQPLWPFKPFPPLQPFQPLQPLWPFKPFPPLQPFQPLQPLWTFKPFPPLQPFQPLPPLRPFQPFPPLPPLKPLQPLLTVAPLSRMKRFFPPLKPLRPLRPLKPLFPRLKPLFPRLKPLKPLKPLFDNNLERAFNSNFKNQELAFNAARKAFDLTSNQAGYIPNFPTRFGNDDFDEFNPFMMPYGAQNMAFAGAAAGPGYTHQIAALSPENPSEPNINVVNRFNETPESGGNFYSVSSSSYVSSANVNGQELSHKGSETLVNNNGVVTHYKVQN